MNLPEWMMASKLPDKDAPGSVTPIGLAPEGEEAWIEVIRNMDAVYRDLVESQTQLERQHAAMQEARQFIDSVMESMTDVLIACDMSGRIEQVNPAMLSQSAKAETELLGALIHDLFDDQNPAAWEQMTGCLRSARPFADLELHLKRSGQEAVPLSLNGAPRFDHRGRPVGFVIVGRPIGELRRAYQQLDIAHQKLTRTQQQLVNSEKMAALGRVVAGVAHELNNPISFVFGNMHALKRYGRSITTYLDAERDGSDPDAVAELRKTLKIDLIVQDMESLIEGTLEGAERVRAIVADLRRFSSNQREAPERFDLIRLLRTAVDWVIRAERARVEVVFDGPDQLDVTARKGHLHQVVVNLVQNAADVLGDVPDPRIEISCELDGDDVVVRVRDNGAGVPASHLDQIFEPFFTTKPIGRGTGLGLYVSYGLMREQGGDLAVANDPAGGAVFTMRFPAEPAIS